MDEPNKWVRPVSFNRNNKKDQERLSLVGKKAFSTFVKKLIDEEIERRGKEKDHDEEENNSQPVSDKNESSEKEVPVTREKVLTSAERLEQLKKRRSQGSNSSPQLFIKPNQQKD